MARLVGTPNRNKFSVPSSIEEQSVNLATTVINGGMNTYIDPVDISDSQLTLAKNCRIEGDTIGPRVGTSSELFPTKPNSLKILNISVFTRFTGASAFVRFDPTNLFRRGVASWIPITGPTITVEHRQHTLAAFDRFFFTTGRDPIQEINLTTNTYAPLGNAPRYKYVCSFFNRIIGANLYDATNPNPIQIGGSGDLNFTEWSPLVDISAFYDSLVEGEGDYSDKITGLFGFASTMLIPRERSLWIATKRAVASSPLQYQAAFTNVGCDSPDAIAQTRNGITWYDYRSQQVYAYEIGSTPEPIGHAIRNELRQFVKDSSMVFGSYDPVGHRFHLTIPAAYSNTTLVYVYDFETKSWTRDERLKCYGVFPLDVAQLGLSWSDVVGTWNDVMGSWDSLDSITTVPSTIVYGHTNGDITQDNPLSTSDNGDPAFAQMDSKIFALNPQNVSIQRMVFKLVPRLPGSIDFSFSRDGGNSFELYKSMSFGSETTGRRQIITCPRHITTSEFKWRIFIPSGRFDLLEYRLEGVSSSDTRAKG